jgi:type IV secretory pathway VirB10-like protein
MSKINDDLMSPNESPGEQSKRSGVRRVNNMPVYIVVGGLAIFLLIMILVASDRATKQNLPAQPADVERGGNTIMFAKEIAGDQKDGIIQAKAPTPPEVPEPQFPPASIAIVRPENLDIPPLPPNSQQSVQTPPVRSQRDDEADRIRVMKLQQFDEAVKARTSIAVVSPRNAGGSPGVPANREEALARLVAVRQQAEASADEDPMSAYQARLRLIQSGLSGGDQGAAPQKIGKSSAGRNDITQFVGPGGAERWKLESQQEAPRTPYELRAGFVVPATLISGVNSELAGQIIAQVSQNVYDTPLGKFKLIPQGARLIGSYSSEVAYGQSRVFVAWQRIIFPDGRAMDIGSMPGANSAGYAGFRDQVNNHFLRLFSSAFLMSSVTAGIALSQPPTGNANSRPTAGSAMSEALGQQLGQATAQLIAKNLNIAPTLEIRPGYRFNVVVVKDMVFSKPYVAFDY